MSIWDRVKYVFSRGTLHVLFQPTAMGSIRVADIMIGTRSLKREARHGDS